MDILSEQNTFNYNIIMGNFILENPELVYKVQSDHLNLHDYIKILSLYNCKIKNNYDVIENMFNDDNTEIHQLICLMSDLYWYHKSLYYV